MKKFLSIISLFLAASLSLCVAACGQKNDDKVSLIAIDGDGVGVAACDYYVVPEPAASTKAAKIEGLSVCGSLQSLYGEGGYPQAVLVAKNELSDTAFLKEFCQNLQGGREWLLSEDTAPQTIVNAVTDHLTNGLNPTFNAKNLSKTVIENCGIYYESAASGKQKIKDFMQSINAVSSSPFGTPADEFFFDGNFGSQSLEREIKVYAPDGAPALALANLLGPQDIAGVTVKYEIVDAQKIATFVSANNPAADVCVLPVNLAVKLLGSGEKYKLLATLTHGNLFIMSKSGEEITENNIKSLGGKTVGVVNLAAVPGLTFKLILKKYGVEYVENSLQ